MGPDIMSAKPASKPKSPSGNPQARALAETVVSSFIDRLTAEAQRKGGSLTIADIQALSHEMEKKTAALEAVFEKSFEEYVQARERLAWDQARSYPFDRLMVKTFSHLFPGESGVELFRGGISRRALPGFLMAMNKMLGAENVEAYQVKVRAIVARLRDKRGPAFDWNDLYADNEARAVVIDALIGVAPYFEAVERRKEWLEGLINSHLTPVADNAKDAGWEFGDDSFYGMVDGLFADLRAALGAPASRTQLELRYGKDVAANLDSIFARIDRAKLAASAA